MNEATTDRGQIDEDFLIEVGTPDEALETVAGRSLDPYKSIYLQFGC